MGEAGAAQQALSVRVLLVRPWPAALLAGAVAALGFAPCGWWPLTLLAFAWLLAMLARTARARAAFALGWWFGLGHFALGLNWIVTAFTFQTAMPPALGWLAVLLLAAWLALFPALACAGAWLATRRGARGLSLALALAGAWVLGEWLRGTVATGFPWNPLGAVALGGFARPGLATIAGWTGTYALAAAVILLAAAWRAALACFSHARWGAALALAVIPPAAMLLPLHGAGGESGLAFTLVQPNRAQAELNDPAKFEAQFQTIAALSAPRRAGAPRLVLWPESGIPDYLRAGYPAWVYRGSTYRADPAAARARLGQAIGAGGLLLTGAADLETEGDRIAGARNVITAIDATGAIRGSYAKAHLVPFGEYVPLRWLLGPLGLARLVPGDFDMDPGPGPRTLDFGPWGRIGMALCYEIIFPGAVVDRAHRPAVIFNPSNDGWYGAWGPPQHLAQARLRAIEEGLPVLRATTTGISAVIDADGVVRASIPLGRAGRIDGRVPAAHRPTAFARAGHALTLLWAAALAALSLVALRREAR